MSILANIFPDLYSLSSGFADENTIKARRVESGITETAKKREKPLAASVGVMNATLIETNNLLRTSLEIQEDENAVLHAILVKIGHGGLLKVLSKLIDAASLGGGGLSLLRKLRGKRGAAKTRAAEEAKGGDGSKGAEARPSEGGGEAEASPFEGGGGEAARSPTTSGIESGTVGETGGSSGARAGVAPDVVPTESVMGRVLGSASENPGVMARSLGVLGTFGEALLGPLNAVGLYFAGKDLYHDVDDLIKSLREATSPDDKIDPGEMERSSRAQSELHQGSDMEAHRAEQLSRMHALPSAPPPSVTMPSAPPASVLPRIDPQTDFENWTPSLDDPEREFERFRSRLHEGRDSGQFHSMAYQENEPVSIKADTISFEAGTIEFTAGGVSLDSSGSSVSTTPASATLVGSTSISPVSYQTDSSGRLLSPASYQTGDTSGSSVGRSADSYSSVSGSGARLSGSSSDGSDGRYSGAGNGIGSSVQPLSGYSLVQGEDARLTGNRAGQDGSVGVTGRGSSVDGLGSTLTGGAGQSFSSSSVGATGVGGSSTDRSVDGYFVPSEDARLEGSTSDGNGLGVGPSTGVSGSSTDRSVAGYFVPSEGARLSGVSSDSDAGSEGRSGTSIVSSIHPLSGYLLVPGEDARLSGISSDSDAGSGGVYSGASGVGGSSTDRSVDGYLFVPGDDAGLVGGSSVPDGRSGTTGLGSSVQPLSGYLFMPREGVGLSGSGSGSGPGQEGSVGTTNTGAGGARGYIQLPNGYVFVPREDARLSGSSGGLGQEGSSSSAATDGLSAGRSADGYPFVPREDARLGGSSNDNTGLGRRLGSTGTSVGSSIQAPGYLFVPREGARLSGSGSVGQEGSAGVVGLSGPTTGRSIDGYLFVPREGARLSGVGSVGREGSAGATGGAGPVSPSGVFAGKEGFSKLSVSVLFGGRPSSSAEAGDPGVYRSGDGTYSPFLGRPLSPAETGGTGAHSGVAGDAAGSSGVYRSVGGAGVYGSDGGLVGSSGVHGSSEDTGDGSVEGGVEDGGVYGSVGGAGVYGRQVGGTRYGSVGGAGVYGVGGVSGTRNRRIGSGRTRVQYDYTAPGRPHMSGDVARVEGTGGAHVAQTEPGSPTVGSKSYEDMYAQAREYSTSWGERGLDPQYTQGALHGACVRGTGGVLASLTGDARFSTLTGGNADSYSRGNRYLEKTGKFEAATAMPDGYQDDPSQWRIGDTISATGGHASGNGHIQVWDGHSWVSDGKQTGILPGYGNYTLHRMNDQGLASLNPAYVADNDSSGATKRYIEKNQAKIATMRAADPSKAGTPQPTSGVHRADSVKINDVLARHAPSVFGSMTGAPANVDRSIAAKNDRSTGASMSIRAPSTRASVLSSRASGTTSTAASSTAIDGHGVHDAQSAPHDISQSLAVLPPSAPRHGQPEHPHSEAVPVQVPPMIQPPTAPVSPAPGLQSASLGPSSRPVPQHRVAQTATVPRDAGDPGRRIASSHLIEALCGEAA